MIRKTKQTCKNPVKVMNKRIFSILVWCDLDWRCKYSTVSIGSNGLNIIIFDHLQCIESEEEMNNLVDYLQFKSSSLIKLKTCVLIVSIAGQMLKSCDMCVIGIIVLFKERIKDHFRDIFWITVQKWSN